MRLHLTFVLLAAVLGACGSVHDRAGCGASTECPAGQYCARTGDGNVCWADAVPPAVSQLTVACLDPVAGTSTCLRDGVLRIQATVTDDAEVLGAEVALDVGGAPVPLARTAGDVWAADVQLRRLPFGFFEHPVVATVTAHDGARNTASLEPAVGTTVTRHRFARSLDTGVFGLGHPAVMQDGTVATAGTNAKVYFVPWDGSGVTSVVAVGAAAITAAPLALGSSVWIGSEDNWVYQLTTSVAGWQPIQRSDNTFGRILGSLAATSDMRVLAATESGFLYVLNESGFRSGAYIQQFSVGPIVDSSPSASIFAATGGAVRRMTVVSGASNPDPTYSCALGLPVTLPIAHSGGTIAVLSTGSDGLVRRCSAAGGDPEQLATTGVPSDGVVVAADGSLLVPEQTKTVSRWTAAGAAFPGWQKPDLGGATRTPLVLSATTPFVVPTAKGALHALHADGTIAWSGQLSAGTAPLQPGNIFTPPGQPAGEELSTAYFAGSDGVLHAVIVDGKLDASAPWPKAFHDPRNTNRAGAQP